MSERSIFALVLGMLTLAGCSDTGAVNTSGGKSDAEKAAVVDAVKNGADAVLSTGEPAKDQAMEDSADDGLLSVGDAAPPISIAKWAQGEPITSMNPDKVYVVEFWATWCGPCLRSMPHIAELQAEYGDKVAFIGVSDEDDTLVSDFLNQVPPGGEKKWSEILTYRIAVDDNRKTNAAYMEAANQGGIPCAFIVGKSSKVEWIGHPMEIDEPLKQVVDGTWDLDAAKAIAAEQAKLAAEEQELEKVMNAVGPEMEAAINDRNFKKAIETMDSLIARFPRAQKLPLIRFQFQLAGDMADEANETAKILIGNAKEDVRMLDQLAWMMATTSESPNLNMDLALSTAKKAVELSKEKDVSAIETLARVYFRMGNGADAVAQQNKAISLAANPRHLQQLRAGLAKYQAAVSPAAKAETPAAPDQTPGASPDADAEKATPQ